eukprot:TRINITY_DN36341_c0_g1_i1.p3 TRINITY_DN36341_c0_g1~~TRINITY_DN36341_c0_g1_i1.p3  ORF type:complete len:115 (-),score=0.49 TRINITY_DN36341_c0_g1_i1:18-362(-)
MHVGTATQSTKGCATSWRFCPGSLQSSRSTRIRDMVIIGTASQDTYSDNGSGCQTEHEFDGLAVATRLCETSMSSSASPSQFGKAKTMLPRLVPLVLHGGISNAANNYQVGLPS